MEPLGQKITLIIFGARFNISSFLCICCCNMLNFRKISYNRVTASRNSSDSACAIKNCFRRGFCPLRSSDRHTGHFWILLWQLWQTKWPFEQKWTWSGSFGTWRQIGHSRILWISLIPFKVSLFRFLLGGGFEVILIVANLTKFLNVTISKKLRKLNKALVNRFNYKCNDKQRRS